MPEIVVSQPGSLFDRLEKMVCTPLNNTLRPATIATTTPMRLALGVLDVAAGAAGTADTAGLALTAGLGAAATELCAKAYRLNPKTIKTISAKFLMFLPV